MMTTPMQKHDVRSGTGRWFRAAAIFGLVGLFALWQTAQQFTASPANGRVSAAEQADGDGTVTMTGELKQWHNVVLNLAGPEASETGNPNPFTDYRMDVTFTNGAYSYTVPGYFAADGNAAESSATSGNVWRAHLSPDITGTWTYSISFKSGSNVAINGGGSAVSPYDGITGSFSVSATDKVGVDFRGKGRLEYVDGRYLRFAGNNEYFVKAGADSPENFLNYLDFDDTLTESNTDRRRDWAEHVSDWNDGDPTWQNGKGKGMIGAINYLSSEGVNVFSFIPFNVGGDSRDVWPFVTSSDWTRYDVSKLDQWGIVFEHAQSKGLYLHFKTQETENDNGSKGLDGGDVDIERKLYYRELVARFGHNLALNWNLGEENSQSEEQRRAMAQAFRDIDPYDHHIVLHTFPGSKNAAYTPLLGSGSELTGASLQSDWEDVHDDTLEWIEKSDTAGKPWVVANDEQGGASDGVPPDPDWPSYDGSGPSHKELRHEVLWGNLLAGGAGIEAYFGYSHPDSDLSLDDFRSRDQWWDYNRHALYFFNEYLPFHEMESCDSLTSAANEYCFGKTDAIYAVYLPDGGNQTLDLSAASGTFEVYWYDPRNGGLPATGSVSTVSGGNITSLGTPPNNTTQDWVVLVTKLGNVFTPTDFIYLSVIYLENQVYIPPVEEPSDPTPTPVPTSNSCDGADYLEDDGLIVIEIENGTIPSDWIVKTSPSGFTGDSYIEWGGSQNSNKVGEGLIEYKIKVDRAGTYRFQWRSKVGIGTDTKEHNDSWLRFPDAADFYAEKSNGSIVYPKGSGKTPNPNGSGKEGWFKIYMAQLNWGWNTRTSDNDAHDIYVVFDNAGVYTLQISGRSTGHQIDRLVLYDSSVSTSAATNTSNAETTCP